MQSAYMPCHHSCSRLCVTHGSFQYTWFAVEQRVPEAALNVGPLADAIPGAVKQMHTISSESTISKTIIFMVQARINYMFKMDTVGVASAFSLAFLKSFFTTICSEIGDKTFFMAAILAMKHSRLLVFLGSAGALIAMTALSVLLGWAAPNLISKQLTHYAAVALFMFFGCKSIYEYFKAESEDEFAEAAEQIEAANKAAAKKGKAGAATKSGKGNADLAAVILKAFTLTFVAEWGDRSQITTIGLAASSDPYGVGLGGMVAHSLCSAAAVLGGRHLSQHINERLVHVCGGVLFLVFGIHALATGA